VSDPVVSDVNGGAISVSMDKDTCDKQVMTVESGDILGKNTNAKNDDVHGPEPSIFDYCAAPCKDSNEQISSASILGEAAKSSLKTDAITNHHQSAYIGPEESIVQNDVVEKNSLDALVQNDNAAMPSPEKHTPSLFESCADVSGGGGEVHDKSSLTTIDHEVADEFRVPDGTGLSYLSSSHTNSDSSDVRYDQTDVSGALPSSVDGSEPIYEGEERVLETRTENFEDREPVYEGEVVLAEQADKSKLAVPDQRAKDEITPEQGQWCYTLNN
jgi:hypothetical protein